MPGETATPGSKLSEPSGCGTSADGGNKPGLGYCICPVDVQRVVISLTVTVPVGLTVHDCCAFPPEVVLARAVKLLATRDWAAAGVQLIVFPLSVAPIGEAARAKLTVPPEGSVAASW